MVDYIYHFIVLSFHVPFKIISPRLQLANRTFDNFISPTSFGTMYSNLMLWTAELRFEDLEQCLHL
jgi:hypothetical protein